MNRDSHLNFFKFFNESTDIIFLENNLSRAFALCLDNDSFFLHEYIRTIISEDDYRFLYSTIDSDSNTFIHIQINTSTIEKVNYRSVNAIAMTADRQLDMENFDSHEC